MFYGTNERDKPSINCCLSVALKRASGWVIRYTLGGISPPRITSPVSPVLTPRWPHSEKFNLARPRTVSETTSQEIGGTVTRQGKRCEDQAGEGQPESGDDQRRRVLLSKTD